MLFLRRSPPAPLKILSSLILGSVLVATVVGIGATMPALGDETCSEIAPLPERRDRPSLLEGDQGEDVRELQALLALLGYYQGRSTGTFDDALTRAVQNFQTSAGLPSTGQGTTDTWAKLLPHQLSSETCREAP